MRPRRVETIKDLEDFLTQAKTHGLRPQDSIFLFLDERYAGDASPTFSLYPRNGPGQPAFVGIEHWSDLELQNNAEHNDAIHTPPHFVS